MKHKDVVEELVSIILMQEQEIDKLKAKINRVKQYLEIYEEYIESRD